MNTTHRCLNKMRVALGRVIASLSEENHRRSAARGAIYTEANTGGIEESVTVKNSSG
jgi:hypothetical protein